jgi:hypothetical protein
MRRHAQHRVKDVREAFAAALEAAFPGEATEKSIKAIEGVLRFLVRSQARPPDEILNRATTFFETLVRRLAVD